MGSMFGRERALKNTKNFRRNKINDYRLNFGWGMDLGFDFQKDSSSLNAEFEKRSGTSKSKRREVVSGVWTCDLWCRVSKKLRRSQMTQNFTKNFTCEKKYEYRRVGGWI